MLTNFTGIYREICDRLRDVDCAIVRLPSVVGWITCAAAAKLGKPVLIEMVGCPWDSYRFHGWKGSLIAPFAFLATRAAVSRSRFTIYVTQHFLQERYPTKGRSAGISNVNIESDSSRLKRRLSSIPVNKDKLTLGSIGKVDLRYKGYESAVDAVSFLADKGYDIDYELVGPGDQRHLQQQIDRLNLSDRVRLKGPLPSSELGKWFDSIDIYIQPSLSEGLPRSVVEAMSHGLPVILSDVGGHSELVGEDFLYPSGDSRSLANRIIRFMDEDWEAVSSNNFEKSTEYEQSQLQQSRNSILQDFKNEVSKSSLGSI
ncbi:hypothetical protein GCM10010980_23540 [Corynebacterium marinum]|nr:hypothetical protein GCM10010980_23540 [Corynebacterium marinum]